MKANSSTEVDYGLAYPFFVKAADLDSVHPSRERYFQCFLAALPIALDGNPHMPRAVKWPRELLYEQPHEHCSYITVLVVLTVQVLRGLHLNNRPSTA